MGSVGWVESGGVIYNHLSNPNGELAAYYEIETLDNCGGHSDQSNQYHYHLVDATFLIINNKSVCDVIKKSVALKFWTNLHKRLI